MTRKLIFTGIALIGFTLALGSNAWADHDRGKRGHRGDHKYHHKYKDHPGHHYGWHKGKGNPHRYRYKHRGAYCHRDRDHDWYRDRHHRWQYHRDRTYKGRHHRERVVEKHVYHHHPKRHRYDDDRSSFAFMVIDQVLGVAVAVGGTH